MKDTSLYSIVVLAFCSVLLDFMMLKTEPYIFPRDRIFHIFISASLAAAVALLLKEIKFENTVIKMVSALLILFRAVILCRNFTEYFHTFHGSNTAAIVLFSVVAAVMFWKFIYSKNHLLYSFFAMFNITLTLLLLLLAAKSINVVNIYSNDTEVRFEISKLFMFFDVFTVSVLIKDKEQRMYAQKRLILTGTFFMILITLLQGLCVSGNILYSVSPLQSLTQIFYTETIKRYDYIFSVYYTLDYFAAVMLYTWAFKSIYTGTKGETDENI